jgi:ribosomal protein L7/L12
VDAKISGIVDQIEKLTLLEASDLVSALKTRLNITEIAMPAASAPAAAAPAAAEEVEEAAKPKEKTVFTLKLTGLKDPTAKAKVIREVKATNSNMCVSLISRAALSARSPISRLDEGSLWSKQCRQEEPILTSSRRCGFAFDTGTWSRPRSSSSLHPRCSRRASTRKTPRSSRRPSRLQAALSSSSKSFAGLALIPSLSLSLSLPTTKK